MTGDVGGAGRRQVQGIEAIDCSPASPIGRWLVARIDSAGVFCSRTLASVGDRTDQAFAIIEDQQRPAPADGGRQGLAGAHTAVQVAADRSGDGAGDELIVGHRRQVDEPDAIGKPLAEAPAKLHRKSRLAVAAGTDEGDQPLRPKASVQVRELGFAANKGVDRSRQIDLWRDRRRRWSRRRLGSEPPRTARPTQARRSNSRVAGMFDT